MTKPRYTTDPVSTGDPAIDEWLMRQFQRLDDYWPQDIRSRLEQLETSWPYLTGTWPIVDASDIGVKGLQIVNTIPDGCQLGVGTWTRAVDWGFDHGEYYGDGKVEVTDDGLGMVYAGGQSSYFQRYRRNSLDSPWVLQQTYDRPEPFEERTEGWGYSVALVEAKNYLVVGCPYADLAGQGSGSIQFMTGNTEDGFGSAGHYNNTTYSRNNMGSGMAVSADGNVLAVTGSGTSSFGVPYRIWIFDWNGNGYTFRYSFTPNGEAGSFGAFLNNDGSTLIAAHAGYGVGSTGRCIIYDDNGSGTYTVRQNIDRPETNIIGGWYPSSTNSRFANACYLSPNEENLYINAAGWQINFNGYGTPNWIVYKLNTSTNLYEYCNITHTNTQDFTQGIYAAATLKLTGDQGARSYHTGRIDTYPFLQSRLHEYKIE